MLLLLLLLLLLDDDDDDDDDDDGDDAATSATATAPFVQFGVRDENVPIPVRLSKSKSCTQSIILNAEGRNATMQPEKRPRRCGALLNAC